MLLAGCSDDIPGPGGNRSLSPPTWAIGSWEIRAGGEVISTLVFSSDNVIWTSSSIGLNFKDMIASGAPIVQTTSNSSTYSFYLTDGDLTQTYTYTKTSSTTLRFTLNTGGVIQNLDYTKV